VHVGLQLPTSDVTLYVRMHRKEWEKIGQVMGGPGGGDTLAAGKFLNGQRYDFVFDVDVEDGAPPKHLACNRGEDAYAVADRFLEQEGLPRTYRCSCWALGRPA
jgi:PFU (PLAA family ubiquitin binding)